MLSRALRGVRQQIGTQLLSTLTVALALFCMGAALLGLENAGAMVRRWGAPVRVTVFLAEGATAEQAEALRSALAGLPEVAEARYVSPAEARAALRRPSSCRRSYSLRSMTAEGSTLRSAAR